MSRGDFLQRSGGGAGPAEGSPLAIGLHAGAHVDGSTSTFIDTPLGFSAVAPNAVGDYTLTFAPGFERDAAGDFIIIVTFDATPPKLANATVGTFDIGVMTYDALGAPADLDFYVGVYRFPI